MKSIWNILKHLHVKAHARYMRFLNVVHFNRLCAVSWRTQFMRQQVSMYDLATHRVSVIIPVHNALKDVRKCLNSVLQNHEYINELIIVDDGSDEQTASYLSEITTLHTNVRVIRHEKPKRYTKAANVGMRASTGDFVVLLNSDTIVELGWLSGLLRCALTSQSIGIVGPLSSTASWQSVPYVFTENAPQNTRDWAHNDIPHEYTLKTWAQIVQNTSACIYPRLPFLNGFCLLIKRAVIDDIGYFDEATFAKGYGEENDYCIRARTSGWQLVVADDVYIFHAESRSYSHNVRHKQSIEASRKLAHKYGLDQINRDTYYCENAPQMKKVRQHILALTNQEKMSEDIKNLKSRS